VITMAERFIVRDLGNKAADDCQQAVKRINSLPSLSTTDQIEILLRAHGGLIREIMGLACTLNMPTRDALEWVRDTLTGATSGAINTVLNDPDLQSSFEQADEIKKAIIAGRFNDAKH